MTKDEKTLLEELLLGIRDVANNSRITHSESERPNTESKQLEFVRKALIVLGDDLDSIVKLALKRFELNELEDRPRTTI